MSLLGGLRGAIAKPDDPARLRKNIEDVFLGIGAEECDDTDLLCAIVEVPLNHFQP